MEKSLFNKLLSAPVDFLKRVGFKIDEEMIGTYRSEYFTDDHPFRFDVTWGANSIWKWLRPGKDFLFSYLFGTVTADGFCEKAKCSGTLTLRYFDEHRLRYEFWFSSNGREYRFVGEKVNIQPWNLLVSHTTCVGRITHVGNDRLIYTALVFFRLRDIPRFLRSFRLTFGE